MHLPYIKFYPRDWQASPELRSCSLPARAVWIECLCLMAQSERYGYLEMNGLPMTTAALSRIIGAQETELTALLSELERAGVYSVCDKTGSVFSRRMVKDYERMELGSKYGKKGGGNPSLRKKNPKARSQKPEAKGGIKVPYIPPSDGSPLALSTAFATAWAEWIAIRGTMKAPKDWSKMFQKQLEWLEQYPPETAVEILNRSMRNGWQGLFPPEQAKKPATSQRFNQI